MTILMLILFVAGGVIGFVSGRVWEIRSGMRSASRYSERSRQIIPNGAHQPAAPSDLARSEPPMGF
jgi:hypothetical protein